MQAARSIDLSRRAVPGAAPAARRGPARRARATPPAAAAAAALRAAATVPGRPCPLHSRQPAATPAPPQQHAQRRCVRAAAIVSPWGSQIDGQSLASQLFALSLFPYLGFLWHLTRSGQAPRLVLFGFYFLLAFVGATIPAGIYAKTHYGTSLANVDWLHGGAESLLTITNLFLVLGLRQAIREAEAKNAQQQQSGDSSGGGGAAAEPAASSGRQPGQE